MKIAFDLNTFTFKSFSRFALVGLLFGGLLTSTLICVHPLALHAETPQQNSKAVAVYEPLDIVMGPGQSSSFLVEVADTPAKQSLGLMFRTTLGEGRGMLFDFLTPRDVKMWMKNTALSLDMIFIADNGLILSIVENTEPFSEAVISSQVNARYVLEVAAGTVQKRSIKVGHVVHHRLIKN